MKKLVSAICLAVSCGAASGSAQEAETNLHRAFSVMPAGILSPLTTDIGWYYDFSPISGLKDGRLDHDALIRFGGASDLRAVMALFVAGPEAWRDRTGIDPADLRFFSHFGMPPYDITYWGLADNRVAAEAFGSLADQGFAPVAAAPDIVANGGPAELNLAAADMADPWRGAIGQSSAVARFEAGLLQSTAPKVLPPVLDGPHLSDSPFGKTLLGALDAQEGKVLQAAFLGPQLGLIRRSGQTVNMTTEPGTAKAEDEATGDRMAQGIPLYGGLVLADLAGPDAAQLVIALAYLDCATAEAAAVTAAALWRESGPGKVASDATPSHIEVPSAGCAAVITVAGSADGTHFHGAIRALMNRDLAPILIATE